MEILKKYKKQIVFHLLLNLAFTVFITLASYYHTPLDSFKDYINYFAHFLLLQFSIFGFLYLITSHKYIFYTIFPTVFIGCSLFAYFVYTQDISATKSIIQSVLETKLDIAIDLITFPFFLYLFAVLCSLFFIIKSYRKLNINPIKSPLFLLSILGIISFFVIENKRYGTLKNRLPYSLIIKTQEYFQKDELTINAIEQDIAASRKKMNVVFVLGESVRADHLEINGYNRKTTPKLKQLKNIVSFSNVHTPLTYTAVSVPQILTNISINENIANKNIYSIYTVLNKLNIETSWIGNQTPESSYSHFIHENRNSDLIDKFHSVLSFKKESDQALLPYFKKSFSNSNTEFITMHMIGSHWWYESRYGDEFRHFKPVIKSKYIPSNSAEEMINSYDNTIVFLDDFLSQTIETIKNTNSILIYLSDHGELLGENGKWLHAQEDEASKNPAMVIWYSNEFKSNYPAVISAMENNKNKTFSTDFFYHSILDLYEVQNFDYDTSKSIFRTEMKEIK